MKSAMRCRTCLSTFPITLITCTHHRAQSPDTPVSGVPTACGLGARIVRRVDLGAWISESGCPEELPGPRSGTHSVGVLRECAGWWRVVARGLRALGAWQLTA
eukprot:124176-Rhodomonas_salina.1